MKHVIDIEEALSPLSPEEPKGIWRMLPPVVDAFGFILCVMVLAVAYVVMPS